MPDLALDVVLPVHESWTREHAGAVSSVTRGLGRELELLGTSVHVVAPGGAEPPLPDLPSTRTAFSPKRSTLRRVTAGIARRALRALGRSRTDEEIYRRQVLAILKSRASGAVIIHNDPVLAQAASARLPSCTVVLWLHNQVVGEAAAALQALPPSVRIVCVSDAVRQLVHADQEIPVNRMDVVHNGVRVPSPRRSGGRRNVSPDDPLRVVIHGRIDPNKGQVLAARAVASLREVGVPVALTIAGAIRTFGLTADEQAAFEHEVAIAARAAGARVTGWMAADEVAALLAGFDVALVLPTAPDPFPLAGLEALASGCAVVAVPLGGVKEMMGESALLVEPEVASVADALRRLATEPDTLAAYQQSGVGRAAVFSWRDAAIGVRAILGRDATRN